MQLTIGRRIAVSFVFFFLLLVAVASLGWTALDRASSGYQRALTDQGTLVVPTARAEVSFLRAQLALLRFLLRDDPEHLAVRDSELATLLATLGELETAGESPELRASWSEARAAMAAFQGEAQSLLESLDEPSFDPVAGWDDGVRPLADRMIAALENGAAAAQGTSDAEARAAAASADRSRTQLLLGAIGALVLALLAAVLLFRAVSGPLREATAVLASSASEILAATQQQASGAAETSAAVTQTVVTVDEVAQTAEQTAQRATEISQASQLAAEESRRAMEELRTQVESIADAVVALAEQAQDIEAIITSANDIAEQTHLLALNAAVEAARAGQEGRGFGVVATEVRSLAEQSKKATGDVRRILGDIQKATTSAVLRTEQGTKQVEVASSQVRDSVQATAQAAAQIVASAGQQSVGMTQIRQAMAQIEEAIQQNAASSRQTEAAASDLHRMGEQLQVLVGTKNGRVALA